MLYGMSSLKVIPNPNPNPNSNSDAKPNWLDFVTGGITHRIQLHVDASNVGAEEDSVENFPIGNLLKRNRALTNLDVSGNHMYTISAQSIAQGTCIHVHAFSG